MGAAATDFLGTWKGSLTHADPQGLSKSCSVFTGSFRRLKPQTLKLTAPAEDVSRRASTFPVFARGDKQLQGERSTLTAFRGYDDQKLVVKSPFASRVNPMVGEASDHTSSWLTGHNAGLHDPKWFAKFLKHAGPMFSARVFPEVHDRARFFWSADYLTWNIYFDDLLDDPCTPESCVSLLSELLLVLIRTLPQDAELQRFYREVLLEGTQHEVKSKALRLLHEAMEDPSNPRYSPTATHNPFLHPCASAFNDLWHKMHPSVSQEAKVRFAQTFAEYVLLGNLQEVKNRSEGKLLTLETYFTQRDHTSGFSHWMTITDYVEGVHLPDIIYRRPDVQALIVACNNWTSWCNELRSFRKELANGDTLHSLVGLISMDQHCSFQEAGESVNLMLDDKIAEIEERMRTLRKEFGPGSAHRHAVSRYLHVLAMTISATEDWQCESARYAVDLQN